MKANAGLGSISLTDANPVLHITQAQYTSDASVLRKIVNASWDAYVIAAGQQDADYHYVNGFLASQTLYAGASQASLGWVSQVNKYDPTGTSIVEQTGVFANGSSWDNFYTNGVLRSANTLAGLNAVSWGWISRTNYYDASGLSLVEQSGVRSDNSTWDYVFTNGVVTRSTATSGPNAAAWGWISQTNIYDAAGKLIEQQGVATDGSSADTFFVNGVRAISTLSAGPNAVAWGWTTQTSKFDSAGNLVENFGLRSNGTTWDAFYTNGLQRTLTVNAGANATAFGWASYTYKYDSLGRYIEQTYFNANGSTSDYLYNAGKMSVATLAAGPNAASWGWRTIVSYFDAAGVNMIEQSGVFADGSTWDHLLTNGVVTVSAVTSGPNAAAWGWVSQTSYYDSTGKLLEQKGAATNGSVADNFFTNGVMTASTITAGPNAAAWGWTTKTDRFDLAGRLVEETGSSVNGTNWDNSYANGALTSLTVNAGANAATFGWVSYTNKYDSSGRYTEQARLNFDGSASDYFYTAGALSSATITAGPNAAAWGYAEYRRLFDPSGQLLSHAYYSQAGQAGSLTNYFIDRNALVDTIGGLAANGSWAIDLLNGVGGYASTGQVMSALHADGHGGTLLSLGGGGRSISPGSRRTR